MPPATPAPAAAASSVTVGRLRAGRDIDAVFASRRRRAGELAVLHAHRPPSVPTDGVRVAVVASKRVGSAVRRNRAKRLLREAARRTPWVGGLDAVLIARPGCAERSAAEVSAEVDALATALGVVRAVEDVHTVEGARDGGGAA